MRESMTPANTNISIWHRRISDEKKPMK